MPAPASACIKASLKLALSLKAVCSQFRCIVQSINGQMVYWYDSAGHLSGVARLFMAVCPCPKRTSSSSFSGNVYLLIARWVSFWLASPCESLYVPPSFFGGHSEHRLSSAQQFGPIHIPDWWQAHNGNKSLTHDHGRWAPHADSRQEEPESKKDEKYAKCHYSHLLRPSKRSEGKGQAQTGAHSWRHNGQITCTAPCHLMSKFLRSNKELTRTSVLLTHMWNSFEWKRTS